MADTDRTLTELDEYLCGAGALRAGEALGIFKQVVGHMIRQQTENAQLRAEIQRLRDDMLTPEKLAEHQKRFG